ncbi:MAG: thioredoxin domain-containing protein [Planctomycetota bacterium]
MTATDTPSRINWNDWTPDAFARARSEGRLVLVALMARWCHQCHVMDRETFAHPDVIERVQQYCVPVRVDRDERPDLDRRLQEAAQILRVGGGWPLLGIFTPEGDMAFATTWLPPHDDHARQRRGLAGLLDELHSAWRSQPDKVRAMGRELVSLMGALQTPARSSGAATEPLATTAVQALLRAADPDTGGLRTPGARFPHPALWEAVMLWSDLPISEDEPIRPVARELCTTTLAAIALGGLHDHLGEGFFRYSLDANWNVPEFEKLTDANAALLRMYGVAWRTFGDPLSRRVAAGTVRWLLEDALSAGGGFCNGIDADASDGEAGRTYTFTLREVDETLPEDEADAFAAFFGVHKTGDLPAPRQRENVLRVTEPLGDVADQLGISVEEAEARIQRAADALLAVRRKRPVPGIDARRFVAVNAEVASALLMFSRLLPDDTLARPAQEQAVRTLDLLINEASQPRLGFLHRVPDDEADAAALRQRTDARFLADQAFVAQAMLDAWQATAHGRFLQAARDAVAFANHFLWHDDGGYHDALPANDDDDNVPAIVRVTRRPVTDSPQAGANGVMLRVLVRLFQATNDESYLERARATAAALSGQAQRQGFLAATFALGMAELDDHPPQVLIAGSPDDPDAVALHAAAMVSAPLQALVAIIDPAVDKELAAAHGLELVDDQPAAYVCISKRTKPPITDPSAINASVFEEA